MSAQCIYNGYNSLTWIFSFVQILIKTQLISRTGLSNNQWHEFLVHVRQGAAEGSDSNTARGIGFEGVQSIALNGQSPSYLTELAVPYRLTNGTLRPQNAAVLTIPGVAKCGAYQAAPLFSLQTQSLSTRGSGSLFLLLDGGHWLTMTLRLDSSLPILWTSEALPISGRLSKRTEKCSRREAKSGENHFPVARMLEKSWFRKKKACLVD